MKYSLVFSTCILLLLTSCQKEFTPEGTGNNGGGGGTSSSVCKDCIYFPSCDGSIYNFKDSSTIGAPATTIDTLHYVKDSTINGVNFRKVFFSSNPQQYSFLSCAGGVVKTLAYNPTSQGGTTVSKVEIIALKYLAPVGEQWTDTINFQGQQALYKSTLTEKNISYVVAGKTYADVMHVTTLTGQDLPVIGFTALIKTDYYFGKGIGLIESISTSPQTGDLVLKHSLQSYIIP